MNREVHVRFCERRGVRFPPATLLVATDKDVRDSRPATSVVVVVASLVRLELRSAFPDVGFSHAILIVRP